jgi:hypothetical protein
MKCRTCSRVLELEADPLSMDCGGDCVACMAEAGDPDCRNFVQKYEDLRTTLHGMSLARVEDLIDDWQDRNARMVEGGIWQVPPVPVWLEILRNSARAKRQLTEMQGG